LISVLPVWDTVGANPTFPTKLTGRKVWLTRRGLYPRVIAVGFDPHPPYHKNEKDNGMKMTEELWLELGFRFERWFGAEKSWGMSVGRELVHFPSYKFKEIPTLNFVVAELIAVQKRIAFHEGEECIRNQLKSLLNIENNS